MTSSEKRSPLRILDDVQLKGFGGKREYVATLRGRDDEQALSLLVECLCDESAYLRDLAEGALIEKGQPCAPILVPHLQQGLWYTRASVARVLGVVGYHEALPSLAATTQDANRAVADATRDAMAQLAVAGHAVSVARAMNALPSEVQNAILERVDAEQPGLSAQLRRMLRDRELMTASDEEVLREDAAVAEAQDNLEWEVLTGKPSDAQKNESAPPKKSAPPPNPAE